MLWVIAFILLVMWFFGWMAGVTLDGMLHVLLVLAAITVTIQFISSRRGA